METICRFIDEAGPKGNFLGLCYTLGLRGALVGPLFGVLIAGYYRNGYNWSRTSPGPTTPVVCTARSGRPKSRSPPGSPSES